MLLGYQLDTFDQVVAHYESIKPVVSKHHTLEDDCRPIGERRKTHERIVKVDENTYGIWDGQHHRPTYSGEHWGSDTYRKLFTILWERTDAGDFVSFRGSFKNGVFPARQKFLMTYCPNAFRLVTTQGALMIENMVYEKKLYPMPRGIINFHTLEVDGAHGVQFKVLSGGGYEYVNNGAAINTGKIDRMFKHQYKEAMDKFYEDMLTLAPFAMSNDEYIPELIKAWGKEKELDARFMTWSIGRIVRNHLEGTPEILREIVSNPDNEYRPALMSHLVDELGYAGVSTEEDLKKFRSEYVRWCNHALDFYKKDII